MTYNLNLTENYCAHWTKEHALRELIANTIDEQGTIELIENRLVLTTPGFLPVEAFLMGYSAKNDDSCIGQYGEGLKLAVLILLREHIPFDIVSGNMAYNFSFKIPEGMSLETLHLETETLPMKVVQKTQITVADVTQEELDKIYINAPVDSVTLKPGFYCQGLLVEEHFYFFNLNRPDIKYGINVNTKIVSNRDRNYYIDKAKFAYILEKSIKPAFFVNWWCTEHEGAFMKQFSDDYKQQIAKAYLKVHSYINFEEINAKRIIFSNKPNNYIKDDSVIISPVYWSFGDYLRTDEDDEILKSLKLKTDEELKEELKDKTESYEDKRVRLINEFIDENKEDTPLDNEIVSLLLGLLPMSIANKQIIAERLQTELGIEIHNNLAFYNLYKE